MSIQYVIITGASSGIGAALAKEYAKHGYSLILIARSKVNLEKIKKDIKTLSDTEVILYPCDCSKKTEIDSLIKWITDNHYKIATLINNAGIGYWGKFIDEDRDSLETMLSLNITGLTYLTRRILDIIPEHGAILNVSSAAACIPPAPMVAAYAASKKYVYELSKSLNYELKEKNILVSVLCPPDVETGFQKQAGGINYKPGGPYSTDDIAQYTFKHFQLRRKSIVKPWSLGEKLINNLAGIIPRHLYYKIITQMVETRIKT